MKKILSVFQLKLTTTLIFITFLYIIDTIKSLKIIPDQTHPITISSTNAGAFDVEYDFKMSAESDIQDSCFIKIDFPSQKYIKGLGLRSTFTVYAPSYGSVLSKIAEVENFSIRTRVGYQSAGTSFNVIIQGIQNPYQTGGTGNFAVYYVCNTDPTTWSSANEMIIDFSLDYGNIAVTDTKQALKSAEVQLETSYTSEAGLMSNYLFHMVPTADLKPNINFRMEFPPIYNFTYLKDLVTDFPSENPCEVMMDPITNYSLSGNFTCNFLQSSDSTYHIIEWIGNNASISKSSDIW